MPLYIARHGQTDWNLAGRYQSHTDIPLNEVGEQQAREIGQALQTRNIHFASVFCSPLQRATKTAEIIAAGNAVDIQHCQELKELFLGEYEGQYVTALCQQFGEAFTRWRNQLFLKAAPKGENLGDGIRRVLPLLQNVSEQSEQQNVLFVAHQAINIALKVAITGKDDLQSLQIYKQANNTIEVWDLGTRKLLEQITV